MSRREIEVPWTCKRDGECCTSAPYVLMTHSERQEIERVSPAAMTWQPDTHPALVRLMASPCPLYDGGCTVYAVRPYNCRRFSCSRPDPKTEPFESGGPMGCYNLSERVDESLRFMNWYRGYQRRAQREWGDSHGWHKGLQ